MAKITQKDINDAVWKACDTFRGSIDPSVYKDYVLTMLFLKYLSDVHDDKLEDYLKNIMEMLIVQNEPCSMSDLLCLSIAILSFYTSIETKPTLES